MKSGVFAGGRHRYWQWPSPARVCCPRAFVSSVKQRGRGKLGPVTTSRWPVNGALAAGCRHSVVLRSDGTVVAAGRGAVGECDADRWRDVVAVAVGNVHAFSNTGKSHTLGLRADGTVLATGWNAHGQCDVDSWMG